MYLKSLHYSRIAVKNFKSFIGFKNTGSFVIVVIFGPFQVWSWKKKEKNSIILYVRIYLAPNQRELFLGDALYNETLD